MKDDGINARSGGAGIQFLPPSVKHSKYMYTVENGSIRIGLGAIKGVTPTFYDAIKRQERSDSNWKTMFDLAASLGGDVFTEKAISPLIKAGALDEFGESRAVFLLQLMRRYPCIIRSP